MGKQSINFKKPWLSVLVIFLIALMTRTVILWKTSKTLFLDGMIEGPAAANLADGKDLVMDINTSYYIQQQKLGHVLDPEDFKEPPSHVPNFQPYFGYHMPGELFLMAATFKLFGQKRYLYLQWIQALADALIVFPLFFLGKKLLNDRVGLLAGFLYAVRIPSAYLATTLINDAWISVLWTSIGAAWIIGLKRKLYPLHILTGFLIGVAAYFRTSVIPLPFFLTAVSLVLGYNLREAIRMWLCLFLPLAFLLLPWTIRNYNVFHRFLPTQAGFWAPIYGSLGEFPNQWGIQYSDEYCVQLVAKSDRNLQYGTKEFDDWFKPKVLKVLKDRPFWYVSVIMKRVAKVLYLRNHWGFDIEQPETKFRGSGLSVWEYARSFPRYFTLKLLGVLENFVIMSGALCGIWICWKHHRETLILAVCPIYNILLNAAMVYMNSRYILPGNTLLLIFNALVLTKLWFYMRRERSFNRLINMISQQLCVA